MTDASEWSIVYLHLSSVSANVSVPNRHNFHDIVPRLDVELTRANV